MKHLALEISGPNEWAEYEPTYAAVSFDPDLARGLLQLLLVQAMTKQMINLIYPNWTAPTLEVVIMDTIGVEFMKGEDEDLCDRIREEGVVEVEDHPGEQVHSECERTHITGEGVFWSGYERHGGNKLTTQVVGWEAIEKEASSNG